MGKLASIDLFSGSGALTLALAGIAEPVLYCDKCEHSRNLLRARMADRTLPEAPVYDDVKTLRPPRADMVVGGFPCVGFSAIGRQEYFKNEHSNLFFEMVRVVRESGATSILMENVPDVRRELTAIHRELDRMGFSLRWTVMSAASVGAPHMRRRWYGLAWKESSPLTEMSIPALGKAYRPYPWPGAEPARTKADRDGDSRRSRLARWGLLGNGVVPDAARLAFLRLVSLGSLTELCDATVRFEDAQGRGRPGEAYGAGPGTIVHRQARGRARLIECPPPQRTGVSHTPLCLDPSLVPAPASISPLQTAEICRVPVEVRRWATPRHSMSGRCNVLTSRSRKDLPTQIYFERGTKNRKLPPDPDFGDWLMGLAPGFTDPTRPLKVGSHLVPVTRAPVRS